MSLLQNSVVFYILCHELSDIQEGKETTSIQCCHSEFSTLTEEPINMYEGDMENISSFKLCVLKVPQCFATY